MRRYVWIDGLSTTAPRIANKWRRCLAYNILLLCIVVSVHSNHRVSQIIQEFSHLTSLSKHTRHLLTSFLTLLSNVKQLFFVASCTAEDNFMELIDQDLDVWLTKLEKKYVIHIFTHWGNLVSM